MDQNENEVETDERLWVLVFQEKKYNINKIISE